MKKNYSENNMPSAMEQARLAKENIKPEIVCKYGCDVFVPGKEQYSIKAVTKDALLRKQDYHISSHKVKVEFSKIYML